MTGPDVVVVGGGLAGAAAAIALAERGARVSLLERARGPHDKVCGEFLSGEACAMLSRLGVDPAALGAPAIETMRISAGRLEAAAALPFRARGLTRRRLDAALLEAACERGVDVRRGAAVAGLARDGDFWRVRLADGESLAAPRVVLATGKHDLRGVGRPATERDPAVGLKLHLAPTRAAARALDGAIELAAFAGGYAGLQLVEDGIANLCLVLRESALAGRAPAEAIARALAGAPLLAERIAGARPLHPRPLAVARVPYGFLHRPGPTDPQGLYRVGDQAAVIPSFCGDGMAMALSGGLRAAGAILAGEDAGAHHARLLADHAAQVRAARALEVAARAPVGRAGIVVAARAPGLAAAAARVTRVPEASWRAALRVSARP